MLVLHNDRASLNPPSPLPVYGDKGERGSVSNPDTERVDKPKNCLRGRCLRGQLPDLPIQPLRPEKDRP